MTIEFETVHTNEASQLAVEGPELKKQKIAEDGSEFSSNLGNSENASAKVGKCGYDCEEDYCPDGVYKKDHAVWDKYLKQWTESEGFDIEDFPGVCIMAGLVPEWKLASRKEGSLLHKNLLKCAAKAISMYNVDAEDDYNVVKIENSNMVLSGVVTHYITFQASNSKGEVKSFQAEVFVSINNEGIEELDVELIRLKKNNSVSS